MAEFPKLRTGAVAQYPSIRILESPTVVLRYIDGSEQRFRNLSRPRNRWIVRLSDVSTEELFEIESFFLEQQGEFGSFSFTDPWDGTEYPDCSFESSDFELYSFAEGRSAGTITIRNNQV
jgi:hypothetical protein